MNPMDQSGLVITSQQEMLDDLTCLTSMIVKKRNTNSSSVLSLDDGLDTPKITSYCIVLM